MNRLLSLKTCLIFIAISSLLWLCIALTVKYIYHPPLFIVENSSEFDVPDDATNIRWDYFSWQGVDVRFRFNVPPTDVPMIVAQVCPHQTLKEGFVKPSATEGRSWHMKAGAPDWWFIDRKQGEKYLNLSCLNEKYAGMNFILVNITNHELYEVFLYISFDRTYHRR